MSDFKGRHVCHIADLSVDDITRVLDVAERMVPAAEGREALRLAEGKALATLFFEPSTRTRLSFESAIARLGGTPLTVTEPQGTSLSKGETLTDMIRVVSGYADAIVLRHNHEGAARLAAKVAGVPVVNAGDGAGQHPTQTLLDLFTIRREKGQIEGNRVALVGDLKYGRTVHSLAHGLARFGAELVLVAPDALQMPTETQDHLRGLGATFETTSNLDDVIGDLDVLYMTRIQQERFPDPDEYRKVRGTYRVTSDHVARGKKGLTVLHPLPRVGEITEDVDALPNAKYFEQAKNGVPVRMALLSLLLGLEASQ